MNIKRRKTRTWEDVINFLVDIDARYMLRRNKNTPFLCIRDKQTKKQFSLKPVKAFENIDRVLAVTRLIEHVGNQDWNFDMPILDQLEFLDNPNFEIEKETPLYSWSDIKEITVDYLDKTQKRSSAKNTKADLNNLINSNVFVNWNSIKKWVFQKPLESRPFKNRLDSLEQIRLALSTINGSEPNFIPKSSLLLLREQHNRENKKLKKYRPDYEFANIRGIPTKEEAEKYFDSLDKQFELEKWCLAIQLCYGLRNHEVFHISKVKKRKDIQDADKWIYIPGAWRTKSKNEHYAFPLYPDWIKKYNLLKNFDMNQRLLRSKATMIIKSSIDKTKDINSKDLNDLGVCVNNDYLGEWIGRRLLKALPPFLASIPNKKGLNDNSANKQAITPYDLRHTYAIRLATDPRCSHISIEDASQSMGHDVATHKKHYQYWISSEEKKKQIMFATSIPQ